MINKDEILKRINLKEDKMIVSNILDKYIKYNNTGISTYTNFLDVRILKVVEDIFKYLKITYNIYKVNDVCEKSIIYFGDYNNFVTTYKLEKNNLSHSDILGTLFSIGLDIDTIGDIIVDNDYIYITNLTRLNPFLESSLYTIKNKKVKLEKVEEMILTKERFIDINITVPSYRIDVIVSKLAHLSRSSVSKYITDGNVLINYLPITNVNKVLKIGDIISIRKIGKFILKEEILKSKKDNYVLLINKYN